MTRTKLIQLQAESAALRRMISETPADDVIDLGSLQAQLESVEFELSSVANVRMPAHAKITFSGRPVVGSHGILADFGMKAVNAFSEVVTAVAASMTAPLRAMGPIPNKDQNTLLITNTALGSFGFELEELPTQQLTFGEPSIMELAIERTQNVLSATTAQDDEDLAEFTSDLDQRAINKVRAFVHTLSENDALCALSFQSKIFRFTSSSQLLRTIERLSEGNIQEEEQILAGQFEGVLPKRRTFEFRMVGAPDVIIGKISNQLVEPQSINEHLKESCSITVAVKRVGNGRPRYLLLENPAWPANNRSATP